MKVYVFSSVGVMDGVLFPYEPQVFKTRDGARKMLKRIRDEELIPEYVEIRGYHSVKDEPDTFTIVNGDNIERLSVDVVDVK